MSTLCNHAALVVEGLPTDSNPGGRWWVDAGLGDALHDPMPLQDGVVAQGPMRFGMAVVRADGVGDWHLTHDTSGSFTGVSLVDRPVAMDRLRGPAISTTRRRPSRAREDGHGAASSRGRNRHGPGLRPHPA